MSHNCEATDQRVRESVLSIKRHIRQVHMRVVMAKCERVTIKRAC